MKKKTGFEKFISPKTKGSVKKEQIRQEKKKITKEKGKGKLVLVTSHILSDLDDLVTQILYMQDGRLLFLKSIEDLRAETGEEKLARAIARVMIKN